MPYIFLRQIIQVVSSSLAKDFADKLGIPFLETSAKNSANVEQAFTTIAAEIMKSMASTSQGATIKLQAKPETYFARQRKCC